MSYIISAKVNQFTYYLKIRQDKYLKFDLKIEGLKNNATVMTKALAESRVLLLEDQINWPLEILPYDQ
jgi:hypothetical protein